MTRSPSVHPPSDLDARLGARVTTRHRDQLRWVALVRGIPEAEVLREALESYFAGLQADAGFRDEVRRHEDRQADLRARFGLADRAPETRHAAVVLDHATGVAEGLADADHGPSDDL